MLILGLIILLIVCIVVKIFDNQIRPVHLRKAIVVTIAFAGLLFTIIGIIQLFIK